MPPVRARRSKSQDNQVSNSEVMPSLPTSARRNNARAGVGGRGQNTREVGSSQREHLGLNRQSGRVGRRRRSNIPTSRESLDLLHNYVSNCERNLAQVRCERIQLAQITSQLINEDLGNGMEGTSAIDPPQPSNETLDDDDSLDDLDPILLESLRHFANSRPDTMDELMSRQEAADLALMGLGIDEPGPSMPEGIDTLAAGDGYHVIPIAAEQDRTADELYTHSMRVNPNINGANPL